MNPNPTESEASANFFDQANPTDALVKTDRLSKRYGNFDALADCSVRIGRGDIFGLLGPNGAGKTTLIRLLLGFLKPSGGSCEIGGFTPAHDGVKVRRQIAYLPGEARLPRHLRGSSVLRLFSEMHPDGDLERSLEIAESLELNLRTLVAFMSTGMRQKLALAAVISQRTPLLILDEPTANLDPSVRSTVLDFVRQARHEGRTVVFSSHVLSEIEETCNHVAFLRRGRLVHELSMDDLLQRHRIVAQGDADRISVPAELNDRIQITTSGSPSLGRVQIDTMGDLADLLSWVQSLGLSRIRIEPLGLRAIYDSVHQGLQPTVGNPTVAGPDPSSLDFSKDRDV